MSTINGKELCISTIPKRMREFISERLGCELPPGDSFSVTANDFNVELDCALIGVELNSCTLIVPRLSNRVIDLISFNASRLERLKKAVLPVEVRHCLNCVGWRRKWAAVRSLSTWPT